MKNKKKILDAMMLSIAVLSFSRGSLITGGDVVYCVSSKTMICIMMTAMIFYLSYVVTDVIKKVLDRFA